MKEHFVVHDLLPLAAAGALVPAEQRRVETHLQHCELCHTEFSEWMQLAGTLKELPTPMASPKLVARTQRLLSHSAVLRGQRMSRLGLSLLIVFSWMFAIVTLRFVQLFDMPLAAWLDISSTTVWVGYIGVTWFATALAAGLLSKHYWRREDRTV
jgi:anti-sigma factor RsiW